MKRKLIVNNVSKKFRIGAKKRGGILYRLISFFSGKEQKRDMWVLKKISFKLNQGEILGIIGKNGCGKSTLLRVIAGIYKKNYGNIQVNGKIIPLINFGTGLKPRLTMKDNIFLYGSLLGLGRDTIKRKFNSIVKFADLEDFIDTKLYQFSSGMLSRLAFSIAIHCDADIFLLDELFAVGDENFRQKSGNKIKELVENNASAILVSHNLDLLKKHCDRIIWIENGRIIKKGETNKIINEYIKKNKY